MKASLAFALVFAMPPALAQINEARPCMETANTVEKNLCLGRAVEALDIRLQAEIVRVNADLRKRDQGDPSLRLAPAFSISQANWQSFRKAECDFISRTFSPGTVAPAEGMYCHIEHGRARLAHLQKLR